MPKKQAFGYADAITIAEGRYEALAALNEAVDRITDLLQQRDLSALWDSTDQCITDAGAPIAELVNGLIESRDRLLGFEHVSELTVESLANADSRQASRRGRDHLRASSLPSVESLGLF